MKKFSLFMLMSVSVALFSCKSSNTSTGTDRTDTSNQASPSGNEMQDGNILQNADTTRMQDQNMGMMPTNKGTMQNDNMGTMQNKKSIGTNNTTSGNDTMNQNNTGSTMNTASDTYSAPAGNNGNMGKDYDTVHNSVMGKSMDDMYQQLDMDEDQVNRYKELSNKSMNDRMTQDSNSITDRDALMGQQDKDMKGILSPEQYTKYQTLKTDYYPKTNANNMNNGMDNN